MKVIDNTLQAGDLCLVIQIGGFYCHGFGPGTIVTLANIEIFNFEIRWRCRNRDGDIAWALPKCLRKLPPDQFTLAEPSFDWRNIEINEEVSA
jgi:hypothetical protein